MDADKVELEIVESYELLGEKRYRLRIKGTNIYLNVSANNENEARDKALRMIEELDLNKLIKEVFH